MSRYLIERGALGLLQQLRHLSYGQTPRRAAIEKAQHVDDLDLLLALLTTGKQISR